MKPPAVYAADMLWGQNPMTIWKYQMHFYWMLVFFKPILSMPWTSSLLVELKTVLTWRIHRFHGSYFQWIFSDFQLRMEPWSAWLMTLLFACPMCYRMQAQGGTSSSVHLAGATSVCFPEELTCKCHESFQISKIAWNFGCLSKPLPLGHCLCKTGMWASWIVYTNSVL